jgi:hypothetical protein
VCPPITILLSRPLRTSLEIACRETPRSWAASAWEIQSEGAIDCSEKLVDNVNLLYYTFVHYTLAHERLALAMYPVAHIQETELGQLSQPDKPTNFFALQRTKYLQVNPVWLYSILQHGVG